MLNSAVMFDRIFLPSPLFGWGILSEINPILTLGFDLPQRFVGRRLPLQDIFKDLTIHGIFN
jgi:hypothetical protein